MKVIGKCCSVKTKMKNFAFHWELFCSPYFGKYALTIWFLFRKHLWAIVSKQFPILKMKLLQTWCHVTKCAFLTNDKAAKRNKILRLEFLRYSSRIPCFRRKHHQEQRKVSMALNRASFLKRGAKLITNDVQKNSERSSTRRNLKRANYARKSRRRRK